MLAWILFFHFILHLHSTNAHLENASHFLGVRLTHMPAIKIRRSQINLCRLFYVCRVRAIRSCLPILPLGLLR